MNTSALPPAIWTTGSTEALKTGTWRAALPEYRQAPSPCHLACPVGGRIAAWIQQAKADDWHGAWTTLTEHNPFPAVAGRVCHHPCESACNRADFDAPLAICALERHAGDRALAEGWRHPPAALEHGARIAIIGGGPSGLSAAYQLRRRGYAVTIFEAGHDLGGLLRHGIPPYRLPRAVLDGEIQRVLELGIDVRLDSSIASAGDFAWLRDRFDAVYLAIGARRQKRLAQLDYGATWIMDSADYLARSNAGAPPALGRRLAVIGGGSAAMDVARSARRAGHEVTVLCLESEAQMPAQREEIVQAREEGVQFIHGALLQSAAAGAAGGLRLQCVRAQFEAGPARGQFRVAPIAGAGFEVAADAVVSAIGQDPELAGLAPLFEADGALVRTDARGSTSLEGVFAGGDVASGARFVTLAIGMGKAAALEIDRRLQGQAAIEGKEECAVPAGAISTAYYAHSARPGEIRLAPGVRLVGHAEVQAGLDAAQAIEEAARCFSCGNCIFCDYCFLYCPDMAVRRVNGGYRIAEEYCKGCGLCVRECPTGSMVMREERR